MGIEHIDLQLRLARALGIPETLWAPPRPQTFGELHARALELTRRWNGRLAPPSEAALDAHVWATLVRETRETVYLERAVVLAETPIDEVLSGL
jgi:hypothetical protein